MAIQTNEQMKSELQNKTCFTHYATKPNFIEAVLLIMDILEDLFCLAGKKECQGIYFYNLSIRTKVGKKYINSALNIIKLKMTNILLFKRE